MTTWIDDLRKLADAATPDHLITAAELEAFRDALSPGRVLAMLAVIEAADAMRDNAAIGLIGAGRPAYDRARAALDEARGDKAMIRFTPDGKVPRGYDLPPANVVADALDLAVAALREIHDNADAGRVIAADALRQIGASLRPMTSNPHV